MERNTAIKLLWLQDKKKHIKILYKNILLCSTFLFLMCEIGGKDPMLWFHMWCLKAAVLLKPHFSIKNTYLISLHCSLRKWVQLYTPEEPLFKLTHANLPLINMQNPHS